MKQIVDFVKSMLSSPAYIDGGISSKRLCGVLGWVVVLIVEMFCAVKGIQAPAMTEDLIIVSASLLGLGIFEPFFSRKTKA